MKKILLIISIFATLGVAGQTDAPKHHKNALIFIPHKIFYSEIAIGYERELSHNKSLYALSHVIYREEPKSFDKGFVQSVGLKNYISGSNDAYQVQPELYFMPYVQFGSIDLKKDFFDTHQNFLTWGGGFQIGLGLTILDKVGINLYFAGEVEFSGFRVPDGLSDSTSDLYYYDNPGWQGVKPKGGIEFSYKF